MSQTSDNINARITTLLNQANEQVEFMETRVILLDEEKRDLDTAIEAIDRAVQTEIDDVNSKIKLVADAYQARVDVGCRTLVRWYLKSITGYAGPPPFFLYTWKTYLAQPVGTATSLEGLGGGVEYPPKSRPGFDVKNLYGIKYYKEPHTTDITDTFVGSFIGTIGIGSSVLTVMNLRSSGAIEKIQVGNIIVGDRSNIFAGVTTIVGFSTSVADLSSVGIGSTGVMTLVDTIILSNNSTLNITAPMNDGLFVEFDALKNSQQVTISTIPMENTPLVPQTIGIINSSTLGVGTYVQYDNSGNANNTQSWNPFLNGVVFGQNVISEPLVGAGVTFFPVGFGSTPAIYSGGSFLRYATLGEEVITASLDGSPTIGYENLPSCTTQETNLANAISVLSTKEAEILAGVGTLNQRLGVSNALRTERNRYTLQIWGIRQTLSELEKDKNNLTLAKTALDDPSIAGILT
jgi:hypothetical protein